MPAPTMAIPAFSGSVLCPRGLQYSPKIEHTLRLCLLDIDTANLLLLQQLDPIEPRALRINATCVGHGDAGTLTQPRPLVQLSLLHPLPAILVDLQRLTAPSKLMPCRPSRKAAIGGYVFGKDPHQAICTLFVYRGDGVVGFTLASRRVARAVCHGERVCRMICFIEVHICRSRVKGNLHFKLQGQVTGRSNSECYEEAQQPNTTNTHRVFFSLKQHPSKAMNGY